MTQKVGERITTEPKRPRAEELDAILARGRARLEKAGPWGAGELVRLDRDERTIKDAYRWDTLPGRDA